MGCLGVCEPSAMDDRHRCIYANDGERYDALVCAEDCDGNVLRELASYAPLDGARVLEVGAGTGRLTRQLLARGSTVLAIEPAAAMRSVCARHLAAFDTHRWELRDGDARTLDVGRGWADLALAGWVLAHFRRWYEDAWREEIGAAIEHMSAALRPGGSLVLIETLGTGREEPAPPDEALAELYRWWVDELGFTMRWTRTDYLFADVQEAAATTGFFFGDAFARTVRERGWSRVPECTGLFLRRLVPSTSPLESDIGESRDSPPRASE